MPPGRHLYVGRTGDSSSPNAASPFNRISGHLDLRPNAKSNALAKQLSRADVNPSDCTFEMVAIGPVFPEQSSFESHKPFRDSMAALEAAMANVLSDRGYTVSFIEATQPE